ncbi:MAG: uroporphyrinogen decarboxylase family protein, partial [Eubacterium sp.]
LGARNFIMGSDGFMQHPEITSLETDEYDSFIADPYKTICENALPRMYTTFGENSFEGKAALTKGLFTFYSAMNQLEQGYLNIAKTQGKAVYTMAVTSACVPFDVLSDQLRSFTGISKDIRRMPEKVEAACEALLPCMIKSGTKPFSSRYKRTFVPLHMAPYMRPKDFERFYWPTFKKYIEALDANGVGITLFAEQDWSRYFDYLNELPKDIMIIFEKGDPREAKEKLGDKHILSGFYPLGLLKMGSEQECLDKAKELVDILAPGGHYIFSFDKNLLTTQDVNVDNLKSVLRFVKEYAVYN